MKHYTFSNLCALVALIFFPPGSFAQDLNSALEKFSQHYTQERFFLATDKEIYKPGDLLKLQVFKFSTASARLPSEVLYVDLIDEKGKVLQHKLFRLQDNSVQATWQLPDNAGGFMRLRSYTRTSIANTANAAEIQLFIHSGKKETEQSLAALNSKAHDITLHFYPEGGSLPAGFSNKIVIYATDGRGWPHQVSGDITGSRGQKVSSFTTSDKGYAVISFETLDNAYEARWKEGQQEKRQALPAVTQDGAGLECRNDEKGITYLVKRTEPYTGNGIYQLVVHHLYSPLYYAKLNLKATDIASGFIDMKDIAPGVVYVALLDASNNVVASRLIYHGTGEILAPANTVEAVVQRDGNTPSLDLRFADQQHSGFLLHTRSARSRNSAAGFILPTVFIFGPETSCPVPAVLLQTNNTSELHEELNTLLLMSQWQGSTPAEILSSKTKQPSLEPETGLSYKGRFTHGFKKEMKGSDIMLLAKMRNGQQQFINVKPDENGEFELANLAFEDTAVMQYRVMGAKKSATRSLTLVIKPATLEKSPSEAMALRVDPYRFASLRSYQALTRNELSHRIDSLASAADGTLLAEIKIESKTRTPLQVLNDEYSSGFFQGMENARVIAPGEDAAFLAAPTLLHYLDGRVAGFEVNPDASEDPVKWRGNVTALYINEIPQRAPSSSDPTGMITVEEAVQLRSIPMSDIALVKIFSPPFAIAWGNGAGGAIAVYTKKGGSFKGRELSETIFVPGFSSGTGASQELYYALGEKQGLRLLNWMPGLQLNDSVTNRMIRVQRETGLRNDNLLIQGFDAKGRLIFREIPW